VTYFTVYSDESPGNKSRSETLRSVLFTSETCMRYIMVSGKESPGQWPSHYKTEELMC
jgi:hypothetical protein